jgi:hypothetical protein
MENRVIMTIYFQNLCRKQMQESKAEGYNLATFVVDKY